MVLSKVEGFVGMLLVWIATILLVPFMPNWFGVYVLGTVFGMSIITFSFATMNLQEVKTFRGV